ncbi:hypothetical protein DFH09DRAFT_1340539 [Mycena vulgaris]|nr:hypothetical protein DFH09DRAFT_1340539 [Mycena vulgaris]
MYPAFRFATFAGSLRAHCAFTGRSSRSSCTSRSRSTSAPTSPQKLALERKTVTVPSDSPVNAHAPDSEVTTFKFRTSRPPMSYGVTIPIRITVSPAYSTRRNYVLEIFFLSYVALNPAVLAAIFKLSSLDCRRSHSSNSRALQDVCFSLVTRGLILFLFTIISTSAYDRVEASNSSIPLLIFSINQR